MKCKLILKGPLNRGPLKIPMTIANANADDDTTADASSSANRKTTPWGGGRTQRICACRTSW